MPVNSHTGSPTADTGPASLARLTESGRSPQGLSAPPVVAPAPAASALWKSPK